MHGESGYARIAGDAYYTEPWVTNALIEGRGGLPVRVWEPAAGNGAMSNVLKAWGCEVLETDIDPQAEGIEKRDFFDCKEAASQAIITNPPYSHAQQFIEHALNLTKPHKGMVALLLRNEYDSAKKRKHLFKDHPAFDTKLVLLKRPRWFADGASSPRHNFAWFIWNWNTQHHSRIDWI